MIRGLPASIIAHAAFVGATYLSWPFISTANRTYVTELETVDIDFAEIGEITNIAPLIRTEPEEAPAQIPEEEAETDPVDETLPEAEQDVSTNEVAPPPAETAEDVLPDFEAEKPKPDEKKPEKKPEPKPQATPRRDPLADFLNQSETTFKSEIETRRDRPTPTPAPTEPKPNTALSNAPKPAETNNRAGAGDRNANIARIDAVLYSKIYPCWDGVSDLPYPERLNVRMKLELNLNGTIADLRLVEPARRPLGNSPMGTAVDRALRAVRKCAPYSLPEEDYEIWREGSVNLGPAFAPKPR